MTLLRTIRALLIVLSLSGGAAALAAQDAGPPVETEAQAIFGRVMSPYCPGQLLARCPSPAADALRDAIRRDLRAGRTAEAIEADLYRRFGDGVRAIPPARGTGVIVWATPAVLLAAGGLVYVRWLRRCRPTVTPDDALATGPLPDALVDRLEDELARE
jgi:cytochrome c-type biogenesis protein CcmH